MNSKKQMENCKSRIRYIDCARGIACLLMIVGHLGIKNSFIQWIYSFHMPMFIIISGMTSNHVYDYKGYIKKKIRRLIVPYILFGLIFANNGIMNYLYVLYGSRNSLMISNSLTPLWFLTCIFTIDIIFEFILMISNRLGGVLEAM